MKKSFRNKTTVIKTKARWHRVAYMELYEDKVIFDDSDGEYGPVEFDLAILEEAILIHKQKFKDENKAAT